MGRVISVGGISQLFEAFKLCQKERKDSFSTSLPYYLLTGRKGWKVFERGEAKVTICVHPHDNDAVLVFPEINGDFSLSIDILNKVGRSDKKIQLARYTEEDYTNLQVALESYKRGLIASIKLKPEDIMDWKYPAHILDTKKVAELKGGEYSKLRNKFNKVADTFDETPLNHPDAAKLIRTSVYAWYSSIIYTLNESGEDMTEFYETLAKHLVDFPSMFDGFILSRDGYPLGFTVWDKQGETANALAGLSKREINGMSEYQTVRACQILNEQGVSRYNLGGSETDALNKFKLKFCPADSVPMESYDVAFDNLASLNITQIGGNTPLI